MNNKEIKQSLVLAEYYFRSGNYPFSETIAKKIIVNDPGNPKANELLAYIYGNQGDTKAFHSYLIKSCESKNVSPEALYYLGTSFLKLADYENAKNNFIKSLEKYGDFFEALHDLGTAYCHLGMKEDGLSCYKKALNFRNNSHELFFNMGRVCDDLGMYEDALNYYDKAIEIYPEYINAWNNKGITLNDLKRYDEALNAFDTAIKINPKNTNSYWHKSLTKLVLGEFIEGWDLYEYRWTKENSIPYRHSNINTLESIENINDKNILIWAEQGLGDTIQFSRYISELLKLGPKITFEVQQPLVSLLNEQFDCEVTSIINTDIVFDYQLPLLSLPRLFNTLPETIPSKNSYLQINLNKSTEWKNKLNLSKNRLNIGLSISGNPIHKNDHNRSADLKNIEPLIETANIYLIQKEINQTSNKYLQLHPEICFLGNEIKDFSDSAAIVSNMDLIISVDTSLIHLAGALGKQSFLMLPWSPEWRWLLDRNDSIWYDSIKIFRQESIGDWSSVIQKIKNELNLFALVE